MSQRRGNGAGSVYQRADGKWVASVSIDGRRVVRYGRTKRDADLALADLLVKQRAGNLVLPSDVTLGEWVERWLDGAEGELRPSTVRTYRQVLAPVVAEAGDLRLAKVSALNLALLFTRLRKQGRGERRLHLAHTYLAACLAEAVNLGVIAANPMARVKRHAYRPAPRRYWTREEAASFIASCLASRRKWAPLGALLVTTGLRTSEALALDWKDVDLAAGVIRIRRALVWRGGEYDILPTKTKAGTREVGLPQSGITALSRLPEPHTGPVFRTATGKPPRSEHLRDIIDELCAEASVPRLNPHGLRHVYAMLALEATGDPYLVQRQLGHSHVNVTLGIYGYSTRGGSTIAAALDGLLAGD
jgi:integrase